MAVEITKVFEQSKKYFDKQTLELFKDGQTPFDFPGLKPSNLLRDPKRLT